MSTASSQFFFSAEATTTATFLWALPEKFHVASQNFT